MSDLRSRNLRARLFGKQSGRCHWCSRTVRLEPGPADARLPSDLATLDHLVPRSQNGSTTERNCVVACHACNNLRGALPADRWQHIVATGEARP